MSQIDKSSEDYKAFLRALEFTAKWEGGFSDHPDDVGGRTYKGVTQGSWDSFASSNSQYSAKDVASLTDEEVADFYYLTRWKAVGLDESIPYPLSVAIFDTAVNFNENTAWAFINEAINPDSPKHSLTRDEQEKIKQQVLEMLKNGEITPEELTKKQLDRRLTQHHQTASKHGDQQSFIQGWENRVNDLANLAGYNGADVGEPMEYDTDTPTSGSTPPTSGSTPSASSPDNTSETGPAISATGSSGTSGSMVSDGIYMIKATFERFPLIESMRHRKIFGGYKLKASQMIGVGATDKVGGPGVGNTKSTQEDSNNSSDDSNVEFDYGGVWGDPLPASDSILTSGYQQDRGGRPHPGVDIASWTDADVVASADGVVSDISLGHSGGFGNLVVLTHSVGDQTIYTQYNHMADGSIVVSKGDKVTKGQKLGKQGATGVSRGAHLHFELRNTFSDSRANFLSTHYDPSCVIERWKSHCSYNQPNGSTMMPPNPPAKEPSNSGEAASNGGSGDSGSTNGESGSEAGVSPDTSEEEGTSRQTLYGHKKYDEAPASDLVDVAGMQLRTQAADSFREMVDAASAEGINLVGVSGFRSIADQDYLFHEIAKQRGQTLEERAKVSAPPGYSEHHTGLTVDFGDGNNPDTHVEPSFENTAAYRWLAENGPRYGWEMSFQKGDPNVSYEPWHWRYIGSAEAQSIFR